jgi:asparagine synthase (glutamine-hydrolysing)
MCGIAGIYDRRGTGSADPHTCSLMASLMRHRGPDSTGAFSWPEDAPNLALAVQRLSVVDLLTGDQPITNETGTIVVICNGEIFNHIELRAELEASGHQFQTASDTEVLAHLYEEVGMSLFNHLRGMFAFALWDQDQERLVLAVDHLGIKPLYILDQGGVLRFASEIKAFAADDRIHLRVNLPAVDTFLSFGYMIGEETMFAGVRRLPAGHALVLHGEGMHSIRHSSLNKKASYDAAEEINPSKRILALLEEAVRLQLRGDVPIGIFLSGGIDSAAILALTSRQRELPTPTYSIGYENHRSSRDDESRQAASIARHFEADHHELLLSGETWWRSLLRYASIHDEPNANPSAVSMLTLAELASQDVKVVLTGLGGDEIFQGYPHHRQLPDLLRSGRRLRRWVPEPIVTWLAENALSRFQRRYPSVRRVHFLSAAWALALSKLRILRPAESMLQAALSYEGFSGSEELRMNLYSNGLKAARRERHKEKWFRRILDQLGKLGDDDIVRQLILHTWLPANGLLSLDHVTMAHSLEARVPYFDPKLMAAANLYAPGDRSKRDKPLLREAMSGILPTWVIDQPKHPFSTPIEAWFDDDLANQIQGVLLDPATLGRGLFDPIALERLVRDHYLGKSSQTEMLFRLVILELWFRQWAND